VVESKQWRNFDVNATTGTVTFPSAGTWYDYLGNTTFSATGGAQTISLQPGEFHIYLNRNVNQSSTTPVITIPSNGTMLEARAYPNPIASNYTVEVYVPQSGQARMDLYNINGQSVTTIYERFLPRGRHQIALNRKAIGAAAGTYFITIHTKETQKTIQVTLQ
jgi:hypothetical protein